MWPFTSRRIFGNRWWAVAFVVFVCWQAVDLVGGASDDVSANGANATGAPVDEQQLKNTIDALEGMK